MMRADVAVPPRVARLPRNKSGYPVPFFVAWINGEPDFRIIDPHKFALCLRFRFCWICGEPLGKHFVYVMGPMCTITRTTSEPACHRDCAEFSVQACPHLNNPNAKRRDFGKETMVAPAGYHSERNPGVMAIYPTDGAKPFRPIAGSDGVLLTVNAPTGPVDWWTEARRATRDEVVAALAVGEPTLRRKAELEGRDAVRVLEAMIAVARQNLPAGDSHAT